jgi:hypothetical protein
VTTEAEKGDGLPLPKWVLWLALPGILAPIAILIFIVTTERAHDEERCPYKEHERRELSPEVVVIEQTRSCIEGVEERRYLLERQGRTQLLGERRLPPTAFATGYVWKLEQTGEGEVHVQVQNPGHGQMLFREGTKEEHAN